MNTYLITKKVKAKNINQALKIEKKVEVNSIQEIKEKVDITQVVDAMGFIIENEEDE